MKCIALTICRKIRQLKILICQFTLLSLRYEADIAQLKKQLEESSANMDKMRKDFNSKEAENSRLVYHISKKKTEKEDLKLNLEEKLEDLQKKIESFTKSQIEHQASNSALQTKGQELETILAARTEELEGIYEELSESKESNAQLPEKIEKYNDEIKEKNLVRVELEGTTSQFEHKVKTLTDDNEKLQEEISSLHAQINGLKDERSRHNSDQEQCLAALRVKVDELQNVADGRGKELEENMRQLVEMTDKMRNLESEITEVQKEKEDKIEGIKRLKGEVKDL